MNPRSRQGRGEAIADRFVAELITLGHRVDIVRPAGADDVSPALAQAIAAGAERVLIAGGDGLVHRSLAALVDAPVDVGLLPVGTGNDFARALGLGSGGRWSRRHLLERALGPVTAIDLLHTPGGVVASVATAGFSGRVNETANAYRLPLGSQKYTLATLAESTRLVPMPLRLDLDATVVEQEVCFVAIANTRYFGGGMAICPDADPTDGWLDITVVDPLPTARLLLFLPLVFSGRHVRHPAVKTYRARRVVVSAGDPFWGDGEPLGITTGVFSALPHALRIARGSASRGFAP